MLPFYEYTHVRVAEGGWKKTQAKIQAVNDKRCICNQRLNTDSEPTAKRERMQMEWPCVKMRIEFNLKECFRFEWLEKEMEEHLCDH